MNRGPRWIGEGSRCTSLARRSIPGAGRAASRGGRMKDPRIRRAMQCPHPGCDAWAIVEVPDPALGDKHFLWRCEHGHHGPRVTATDVTG
jgi:hypothetical protein